MSADVELAERQARLEVRELVDLSVTRFRAFRACECPETWRNLARPAIVNVRAVFERREERAVRRFVAVEIGVDLVHKHEETLVVALPRSLADQIEALNNVSARTH